MSVLVAGVRLEIPTHIELIVFCEGGDEVPHLLVEVVEAFGIGGTTGEASVPMCSSLAMTHVRGPARWLACRAP